MPNKSLSSVPLDALTTVELVAGRFNAYRQQRVAEVRTEQARAEYEAMQAGVTAGMLSPCESARAACRWETWAHVAWVFADVALTLQTEIDAREASEAAVVEAERILAGA